MPFAQITITNNDGAVALAQYRTVSVVIDHAALVAAKRSRANGNDLSVRYRGSSAGQRNLIVHVENPNTTTTRVYFCLRESIAASGSSTDYWLRWGNLDAPARAVTGLAQKSQYVPLLSDVNPTGSRSPQPRATFLFYDDFLFRVSSGIYGLAADADPVSTTVYAVPAGTWLHRSSGGEMVLRSEMQSGAHLRVKANESGGTAHAGFDSGVRIRTEVRAAAGASTLDAGAMLNANKVGALSGYAAALGSGYTSGRIGDWVGGTFTSRGTVAPPDVTDRWVPIVCGLIESGGNRTVSATIDGLTVTPWADTSSLHPLGGFGLYDNSGGGAGAIDFRYFYVEVWEGAAEPTVSVTIPAVALPDPGFSVGQALQVRGVRNAFPEYISTRSRRLGGLKTDVFDLRWPSISPEDWFAIRAFFRAHLGGAGSFTYTPPGGSIGSYAIVPGSLRLSRPSSGGYAAEMLIKRYAG